MLDDNGGDFCYCSGLAVFRKIIHDDNDGDFCYCYGLAVFYKTLQCDQHYAFWGKSTNCLKYYKDIG